MDQAIYTGEKQGQYLSAGVSAVLFFLHFLLQQLRQCCKGCLTPFPLSHAELLQAPERRKENFDPVSSRLILSSRSTVLTEGLFLQKTLQPPHCEGFPQHLLLHLGPATHQHFRCPWGWSCSVSHSATHWDSILLSFPPQEMAAAACPVPTDGPSASSNTCPHVRSVGCTETLGRGIPSDTVKEFMVM